MNTKALLFALLFLTSTGCGPEDDAEPVEEVDPDPIPAFDCIHFTDPNGQSVGQYGTCTDDADWTYLALTSEELDYFNPPEVPTWGTATPASVTRDIAVFPNPVAPGGQVMLNLQLNKPASPLLRLAIADAAGRVHYAQNIFMQETAEVQFVLLLPEDHFKSGEVYRLYYQLQGKPGVVWYEGYGDLLVCAFTSYSKIGEECF